MSRSDPTAIHGAPPDHYEGFCRRCETVHRWSNDVAQALSALEGLWTRLVDDPALAAERAALDASPGKMVGVLVGRTREGDAIELRAFSGELAGRGDWPGWAPAVLRREATASLEAETLARIAQCEAELERVEQSLETLGSVIDDSIDSMQQAAALRQERLHWRAERRAASMRLSEAFFDHLALTSARGERRPVRAVFSGRSIAGGTGDCAIPRLLEAANRAGVRPIALGEAWWGGPIGGRRHGACQPPCERKCLPVLGHLLCGL